jgi:hypothetical protein
MREPAGCRWFHRAGHIGRADGSETGQNARRCLSGTALSAKAKALSDAEVVGSLDEVFASTDTVILMLVKGAAIDAALRRSDAGFPGRIRGKLLIHMAAGGAYIEAQVYGSRIPAEARQLVAMLAVRRCGC